MFFGGIDNDIKVWDTRMDNNLLYKMQGHTDSPTGLRVSPDGQYLASNAMDSTSKTIIRFKLRAKILINFFI